MTPCHANAAPSRTTRCAIYTRKSSDEGLDQEFTSLDAQRAAAQAYIASQQHEGWICLPERYDDGGFTGGHLHRPALQRLLADIRAGRIDCLVTYKVDRLSRSLFDFAHIIACLDQYQVAFVSVTQEFNTATSMGRLILNVLLSFAQFERELIAERTRDKLAAARRKGKWTGGMPLLGYDVDARNAKLVVNAREAAQVRAIFALYQKHQTLRSVVQELARRGWVGKRWQTRKGHTRGGQPFTRTSLHRLLTNVTYIGQVRYRNEVHPGEHTALLDAAVWQEVQALLQRPRRPGDGRVPNAFAPLLQGRLHCRPCGCAMTPSHSTKGSKRYRYYVCTRARQRGRQTCPSPSLPAGPLEQLVVEQIARRSEAAGANFADVWPTLPPVEQVRVLQLVLQRVDYDGAQSKLALTFDPAGLERLAAECAPQPEETTG
jgi:site-specific DNA recombinase